MSTRKASVLKFAFTLILSAVVTAGAQAQEQTGVLLLAHGGAAQ